MRVCPTCGAAVDESSRTFGRDLACLRCGTPLGAPIPARPPVVVAPINPFSDQAGPVNPFTNPYAFAGKWEPNLVVARSKVQGPGIILQIYGVILTLAGLACLGLIPLAFMQGNEDDQIIMTIMACVGVAFGVPAGLVVFWGGTKLEKLQSYGWAMAAVIMTFMIGFLSCLPAVLVGIWPLIVILDPEVKASFGAAAK